MYDKIHYNKKKKRITPFVFTAIDQNIQSCNLRSALFCILKFFFLGLPGGASG